MSGLIDLTGKTAVVTGGARGIGRAAAQAMHDAGARVAIVDLDAAAAESAAREIGERAMVHVADVTKSDAVRDMVSAVTDRFGGIDILVNNAAADRNISILDMEEDEWDRLMTVNLKSVFLCTKAALPSMIERGGGSVICIASIVARQGAMNTGIHYAATKGGVMAFTKTLARQMAGHGIRANAVAPGAIDTDMLRSNVSAEMRDKVGATVPLGRLGESSDIGDVITFLASDAARYVTGATIDVNGGLWIG